MNAIIIIIIVSSSSSITVLPHYYYYYIKGVYDLVLLAQPLRPHDCPRGAGADNEEVGHGVNYPKTEAVVFGMPAATAAAATIHVGSNSVAASVQVCGQHCAGRWGAGQGAPEEVVLSRAGLQIPQGKSVLQEGGAGRQAQVL